jgi:hypothetical protein
MDGSQAYTLRKTASTLIWDSYRSQHGGKRKVIGSQSRDKILKNSYFLDLLENSENKRQPIGSQGSGKKIQVADKKGERGGGGGGSYLVAKYQGSNCLARVKYRQ